MAIEAKKDGKRPDTLLNLGAVLSELGEHTAAMNCAQEALVLFCLAISLCIAVDKQGSPQRGEAQPLRKTCILCEFTSLVTPDQYQTPRLTRFKMILNSSYLEKF